MSTTTIRLPEDLKKLVPLFDSWGPFLQTPGDRLTRIPVIIRWATSFRND